MKKFFMVLALLTTALCADTFVLDNQTDYPLEGQSSKIAIQWASTAQDVQAFNNPPTQDMKIDPSKLQTVSQTGKTEINIPANAHYFRVVVWTTSDADPDQVTNWVDIVPGKTYTLDGDYLIPSVLMGGMGC